MQIYVRMIILSYGIDNYMLIQNLLLFPYYGLLYYLISKCCFRSSTLF